MAPYMSREIDNPPAYLPPRRPVSLPNLAHSRSSWKVSSSDVRANPPPPLPPFLPPRTPAPSIHQSNQSTVSLDSSAKRSLYRPVSRQSPCCLKSSSRSEMERQRAPFGESPTHWLRGSSELTILPTNVEPIADGQSLRTHARTKNIREISAALRQSSLRLVSRPSDDDFEPPTTLAPALVHSHSESTLTVGRIRPHTHPSSRADSRVRNSQLNLEDLGSLPRMYPLSSAVPRSMPSSRPSTPTSLEKPKPSFARLSSLDHMIQYREEREEWKRLSCSSSLVRNRQSEQLVSTKAQERAKTFAILDHSANHSLRSSSLMEITQEDIEARDEVEERRTISTIVGRSKFRHIAAEVGFCLAIALTQFLAEYLISGFAMELPRLLSSSGGNSSSSTGIFWPATLLSLILSAMLFFFARLSDMYSGYYIFMGGIGWLAVWTLIPGLFHNTILLDVSRAFQGAAIAAFTPSTFVMVGSIYSDGLRKNVVMGIYAGCAPIGFFAGFATAGNLQDPKWYFLIAAAVAGLTFVMAYLTVPADRTDRRKLGLKMDWTGAFIIVAGLILVSYALAAEPYANGVRTGKTGWGSPNVFGPFVSGIICLCLAIWYEGWCATCPLIPFDFFKPKSVRPLSLACLCFYASYGVWLYNSAQYFQSPTGTTKYGPDGISGSKLAVWYLPTAVGGLILCILSAWMMKYTPMMVLLLISGMAWIAAPLLLALAPLPLHYWSFVAPSMICATIGIDVTFTVSILYFSGVQPLKYQGLSGAMCSTLVNLAMSFALSISEIVVKAASSSRTLPDEAVNWGFKASFIYAAGSAGVGLVICILAVRFSKPAAQQQQSDDGDAQLTSTYSEATLVEESCEQQERNEIERPG